MAAQTASDAWLYSQLSSDAFLSSLVSDRIYGQVAPRDAEYPLIVFQFQGGHDVSGVNATRIMTQEVYVVKAAAKSTSFEILKPIAARLDELLHGARGATPDGVILACVREQPIKLVEIEDGVQYRLLGGIYRIYCEAGG